MFSFATRKGEFAKSIAGFGVLEAHVRRDHLLAQGQRGLDHSGAAPAAGGQVADVALDGTDYAMLVGHWS
jgi:hypothetical protein